MKDDELRNSLGFNKWGNCNDIVDLKNKISKLDKKIDLLMRELGYRYQTQCNERLPKVVKLDLEKK